MLEKILLSYTGSITTNRIAVGMPPPVRDWLARESRYLGITVPALVRIKLLNLWKEEQQAARTPDYRSPPQ